MTYTDIGMDQSYFKNWWTPTAGKEQTISSLDFVTAEWAKCFAFLDRAKFLRHNWHGENSSPPKRETIDSLTFYLRSQLDLNRTAPGPSRMSITPDGAIFVEWQEQGRYMDLEASIPGTADFLIVEGDAPPKEVKVRWSIPVVQAPTHQIVRAISATIDPRTNASASSALSHILGAAA